MLLNKPVSIRLFGPSEKKEERSTFHGDPTKLEKVFFQIIKLKMSSVGLQPFLVKAIIGTLLLLCKK